MSPLPSNVVSIRLFGSMARGDYDDLSDVDVLVVKEDRSGKVPEEAVRAHLSPTICHPPPISWYGRKRLSTMFADGRLFAWHLFHQSKSLWGEEIIAELFVRTQLYRAVKANIIYCHPFLEPIPATHNLF